MCERDKEEDPNCILSHIAEQLAGLQCRIQNLEASSHQGNCKFSSIRILGSAESSDLEVVQGQLEDLHRRLDAVENSVRISTVPLIWNTAGQITSTQRALENELKSRGVSSFKAVRVPKDYYLRDLEYRRQCLGAATTQQLCKSIILENTKAPEGTPTCGSVADSKYYCVIVQYAARLHAEKLKRCLHKLNGKLSIKHFNLRLAPTDVSEQLTSYAHNAVTPICMRVRLPIILSDSIQKLEPQFFWLGAGETHVKIGMPVDQFVGAYAPFVVECTYNDNQAVEPTNCLSL